MIYQGGGLDSFSFFKSTSKSESVIKISFLCYFLVFHNQFLIWGLGFYADLLNLICDIFISMFNHNKSTRSIKLSCYIYFDHISSYVFSC